jgi:hypothetical protein
VSGEVPAVRLLHLVRPGAAPAAGAVAAADLVVYSEDGAWRLRRPDEAGPGEPVDDARLHDLLFACDRAIVW